MKREFSREELISKVETLLESFENPPEEAKKNFLWTIKIECMKEKLWELHKKLKPPS